MAEAQVAALLRVASAPGRIPSTADELAELVVEARAAAGASGGARAVSDGVLRKGVALAFQDAPAAFFSHVLPHVIRAAADGAPTPAALPAGEPAETRVTREACHALLCRAALCVHRAPPDSYPHMSLERLYACVATGANRSDSAKAKVMCFANYFARCAKCPGEELQHGAVAFVRKVMPPDRFRQVRASLAASRHPLLRLDVDAQGTIEEASGCLMADFANQFLGGGTLGGGCVQEEIMFANSPECCVGMLLAERMADNEAVEIVGARRFSRGTGYARSYRFEGDYVDVRPATRIVAFDALQHPGEAQFDEPKMARECLKALVAFLNPAEAAEGPVPLDDGGSDGERCAVATGNWGCGAFGGDIELKALLQWIAASLARRDTRYFSFGDPRIARLQEAVDRLARHHRTVGSLWRALVAYGEMREGEDSPRGVFEALLADVPE